MINTEAYTPNTISDIRFRIPLYQRPYAWESTQIKQLLNDLFSQYEKDKKQKYYIGILSIGKTDYDSNLFDLIDGQQRITTLTLIGSVLKEYHDEWDKFLNYNRLELYGRKEDQEFLYNKNKSLSPNPKMANAINVIKNFIDEKNEKESESEDFSEYVYKNAAFFLSLVPENYTVIEKNLQFVRMNNRGKQLESHEILKIKLADKITDPIKKSDFVKKWNLFSQMGCNPNSNSDENKEIKSLSEILGSPVINLDYKESEIFYQSIVSFPEFLIIALERFKDKPENISVSYSKDKLLEIFGFGEEKIKWEKEIVIDFLDHLEKQYNLFINFFIKRDKEERYKFKNEDKDVFSSNDGGMIEKLKVFQSYLYVSREPHLWMVDALNYLEEHVKKDVVDTSFFLQKLKDVDNKKPDEVDLGYNAKTRYWFWRLDYYLWENRSEFFTDNDMLKVANKYVFRTNRSIEHIAPQTPKTNSIVRINEDILNCFGNLAMISNGQNSSLQNDSYEIKKAHVQSFIRESKAGTIESLKLLKVHEYQNWNDENAIEHGNEMIDILINSFPEKYNDIRDALTNQKKSNHA